MNHGLRLQPNTVRPQAVQESSGLPRKSVRPNWPFDILHNYGWDFHVADGDLPDEWLPIIGSLRHVPGGNGVKADGPQLGASVDVNGARASHMAKGAVVIRNGDARLGEFANWLARYEIRGGGYRYCFPWVGYTLTQGGRAAIPVPDHATQRAFLRTLVTSRAIPSMLREALDTKVIQIRGGLDQYRRRYEAGDVTPEAYEARVAAAEALIERMVSAWESMSDDSAPPAGTVIKPRRVKPSKAEA